MNETILEWKCPQCGKTIKSLYKKQFEYNKKVHNLSHEEKE